MSDLRLWVQNREGSVTGPHGVVYLRRELNAGNLSLDDLGAEEGTEDWMPLETWGRELYPADPVRRLVEGRKGPGISGAGKACPSCGGRVAANADKCPHCGHGFTRWGFVIGFVLLVVLWLAGRMMVG